MGLVALLEADFNSSTLGLKSQLDADLGGEPVLRRTVRNLAAAKIVETIVVAVSPGDAAVAKEIIGDAPHVIHETEKPDIPVRPVLRRLRRWAKDCWRGGLRETSVFAESGNPNIMLEVAEKFERDYILAYSASSPLVDAAIIERMAASYDPAAQPFLFTNSPPGMHAAFYCRRLLEEMCKAQAPVDFAMRLSRRKPAREPEARDLVYFVDEEIAASRGRFSADSVRSLGFLKRLADAFGERLFRMSFSELTGILNKRRELTDDALPDEIVVELTTCGARHWARPVVKNRTDTDMKIKHFEKLCRAFAVRDDILLTLGGYGDPLAHPEFSKFIAAAKSAGAFGIHVETGLTELSDENLEALIQNVDAVSVSLDAFSAVTYNSLCGEDRFEDVCANLGRLSGASRVNGDFPVIIAEFTRVSENEAEWEAFWNAHLDAGHVPLVRGFDNLAGQVEDRSVLPLLPGIRFPCIRLEKEMFVTAQGLVPLCRVDFNGSETAGDLKTMSVEEIWQSRVFSNVRAAHRKRDYGGFELCPECRAWPSVY
ncbi:MAG: radical SAM protein [Planctomycetota bacterium]|jgi:spiro-SPASM protein